MTEQNNEIVEVEAGTEVIVKSVKELGDLTIEESDKLIAIYHPMITKLKEFESQYNEIVAESDVGITKEVVKKARRLRLDMVPVRTGTDKLRKEKNTLAQLQIKANNGVGAQVTLALVEKENKLAEIENHYVNIEKERIEALQRERVEKLSPFVDDADQRDLAKFEEDEFDALLAMKKSQFEDGVEAARVVEEQRLETARKEAEEKEALRIENERLKKEADEKEALRLAEMEEAKRIQDAKDAEIKSEADRVEALRLAEIAEMKRIQDLKDAEADRIRNEAIEAQKLADAEKKKLQDTINENNRKAAEEKKQAEDARIKRFKEAEDVRQAELNKGDAEKVLDLIEDLKTLMVKYTFDSDLSKRMYASVGVLISKTIKFIEG